MSLQDNTAPPQHIDKPRPEKRTNWIGAKVRAALDDMVYDGLTWEQAAIKAGLTLQAMRMALRRPQVQSYLRAERQVLRASLSCRAEFRMVELSEQNDNLAAAVTATKAVRGEQDQDDSAAQHRATPGLTIVITGAPHIKHVSSNEAKPLIDHEAVRTGTPRNADGDVS